jgi:TonB-dependent starch-binding outer membrane protein SusC
MRKIFHIITMLLFVATSAYAQTKAVSGTITESNGAPLPGVSVVVKGTSVGTVTDANGQYSLKAPVSATTLTLSFVGFRTMDAAIPAQRMN